MVVTTSLLGFITKAFSAFQRIVRPHVVWTSVSLAIFTLLTCAYVSPTPASAVAGINQQINFQGRLLNSNGATVPDGYYNIQFKIYQDGDGLSVGNTTGSPAGALMWTENHLNNNSQGVTVKNGFLSVQLGSINAFGSQIDWNQDTLWLSMNIGNTNPTCTPFSNCAPDGEMVPMKRMASVAYSLNSGLLNGLASTNFVQLAQGVQADASTVSSIFINKTASGNLLQLQNTGADVFNVSNAGDLVFGAGANHSISIATATASTVGKQLTLAAGAGGSGTGSAGGNLVLQGGAAGGTDGSGGNLTFNAGAKTGTGTDGTISIGTANTSAITLGQNTSITGTLGVSSNVDTNGSLTVGTADQFVVSNSGIVTAGTWQGAAILDTYVADTLTVDGSSSVNWLALTNYPGACAAGSAVSQLGDTVTCSAFATGTAANYIQNQSASAQTLSDFWISGNGRATGSFTADTSILTAKLDTASAVALNIGDASSPTATVINLNQNTTLATGKSLTVNGDAFTDLTGSGLALDTGALTVDASSSTGFYRNGGNSFSTSATLGTNDSNSLALRTNGTNRATFDTTGKLYVGDGVTAASTGTFTIQGSTGAASNAGYNLSLLGGTGGSNSNGGDITLQGGTGAGTGVQGQVKLSAGGYTTTTIGAYGSNTTISQAAVDSYSSVAISASASGLTITIPAPTTKYDGRVLYIQLTGSNSITLAPNGGSSTSMTTNSVYALVWNTALNGWLAAGTDSNGFIQNQNSSDQTANFRISGVGQANNGFTGPSLDTVAAAGTLTLGGTNATTVNVGNSTAATAVTLQGGTSGTAISIQSGAAGTISVGTANAANTIAIGSSSLSSGTQTITVGGANTAGGTQNVIVGSNSGATAGTTTIQSKDNTTIATNGTTRATFDTSGNLYLGNGITTGTPAGFVIQATGGNAAGVNGSALTIQGGAGGATATGGALSINAGSGGSANGALSMGTANTASITIGAVGIATTNQGNLTVGSTPGSGTLFTNNGATLNSALAVANDSDGGSLGGTPGTPLTAAQSVDIYTSFTVNQTTASQSVTIPSPTSASAGRIIYVANVGSTRFGLLGSTLNAGSTATLLWNGSAWTFAGADASAINNQKVAGQDGDFWIQAGGGSTGIGRADGGLQAPNLERATSGTLSIGTTANSTALTIGTLGVTTTNQGNLTIGTAAGTGTTFTNNGATLNSSLAVANDSDGGILGGTPGTPLTAAQSVDIYTSFTINQTTASQSITIPNPTNTAAGRLIYIANIGSAGFGLLGSTLNAGSTATLLWNGTVWTFAGADGTAINNQNATGQNGDFWIQAGGSSTGVGRADGGLLAPSLERATSGALNLGTTANTTSLALGGSGATGGVTIQGGTTSTVAINTSGAGTVAIGGGNTAAIDIGSVAASSTASTIRIGTSSGAAQTLTMGSVASTSTTTIQGGVNGTTPTVSVQAATNAYIAIGTTNANTVQIGAVLASSNNSTVNIANSSAGAQTVNLGSSSSTSTTTILGGVNGTTPTVSIQGATNAYLAFGTTNANTINIGTLNSAGTTNLTLGSASGATAGTTTIQSKDSTTFATNGTTRATFASGSDTLYMGNGNASGLAASPSSFTIQGTSNSGTGAGGALTIQAGGSGASANGANLTLSGGTSANSVNGLVILTTPTFQNAGTDANCYTGGAVVANDCTIHANSVNNNSSILVGFSVSGKTATLPDPTITTPGRVVYVIGANTSSDFTLSVNGGVSVSNLIALRANATATMVWNGSDWTAAGASSSTTLQAAYDNTLQSSGGAELVVGKTSNTNGLTIRDSTVNPVAGPLVSIQSNSAANLFSVNSNVTDYASNPGAESGTGSSFPASTWSALNGNTTATRYTTAGNYIATGQGSVSAASNGTALTGVKNTLTSALAANNHYNVSFSARLTAGHPAFTDMDIYYSIDGSANSVQCKNAVAISESVWTKVNCSFTAPSSGINSSNAIFIRQTGSSSARTFYVDNLSVTIAADYSLATDGGVDDGTNFATNYITTGTGSTVTTPRITDDGNTASSSAEVVITTGGTDRGIKNEISINPLADSLYRISVYARQTAGASFTDFKIRYTRDGGTNFVDCVDYSTQTVTSSWAKITCYIKTDATGPSNPQLAFVAASSANRTFRIDSLSMTLASPTTPNVQVGSGTNGGPTTLFTLDRGASAPIAGDNESLLGSMYYDTTLGKLQCYELDGWGACGSSPDNIITISPEYTNAVMHGTGVGTMTSDLCSDFLDINDPTNAPQVCDANETYNFYKWTSPQASPQAYSIYVTYQLPTTFKSFASGSTSLQGRVSSTSNASINYSVYKSTGSSMSQCGTSVSVANGAANDWETKVASGAADPSTCGFAAGNSIVFKISMSSNSNANAYIGNIGFTFSNN